MSTSVATGVYDPASRSTVADRVVRVADREQLASAVAEAVAGDARRAARRRRQPQLAENAPARRVEHGDSCPSDTQTLRPSPVTNVKHGPLVPDWLPPERDLGDAPSLPISSTPPGMPDPFRAAGGVLAVRVPVDPDRLDDLERARVDRGRRSRRPVQHPYLVAAGIDIGGAETERHVADRLARFRVDHGDRVRDQPHRLRRGGTGCQKHTRRRSPATATAATTTPRRARRLRPRGSVRGGGKRSSRPAATT